MSLTIDYLGHSGFLAETEKAVMLFDFFRGDLSLVDAKPVDKPLFVFVSHAHGDHFNPHIFSLSVARRDVKYILSFDLRGNARVPETADILYADADKSYEVDGLGTVRTLLSTDEGVAFFIRTSEETLFHAGDLNWWDWEGEDPEWLREQETTFRSEIGKLANEHIDAAFVVLDDRLEKNYAKGITSFLSMCHASFVFPMHFWEDRTVVERLKALRNAYAKGTVILDTTKETHWNLTR